MKVNDIIFGFKVDSARESSELGGTFYELTHIKTGASLCWLDNKDSNKHFSIAFKTPPFDDTGVFHILEHSVLNGSKKYTVKDPFLELIKSSMNTFLNAMTSSDYTIYPVSSRNEQDFINLVSVYLDAVFCPAIYNNPNIFYQEGWHYELNNADECPTYKGVVFNEMKGVFASPENQLQHELYKIMFPDTCYQYEAGGMPESITDLSYKQFIETHTKYYHPSNSRIYLDGNVPFERVLELIDSEYLSEYDNCKVDNDIAIQSVITDKKSVGYFQAEEGEGAYLAVGKPVCLWSEKIKRLAISVLTNYIAGSNDSPLKKAVLNSGVAQDIYYYLDESMAQNAIILIAKQLDAKREQELWGILSQVKADIISNGIDKNELNALINQLEFSCKEIDEPKALTRNMVAMTSWLYGGDPMEAILFSDLFAQLRELVDTDYFEKLLCDLPWAVDECVYSLLLPSSTKDEELIKAENERLLNAKSNMSDNDINTLLELNKSLVEWQTSENTAEELATLPTLPISSVNPKPEVMPTETMDIDGVPVLFHKTADNGITNVNMYFSLTGVDEKQFSEISFVTNLFAELPTENSTVSQLRQRIKGTIGYIDYNVSSYTKKGEHLSCHPYLVVTFSVLNQKLDDAVCIVNELISKTIFNSAESKSLIKEIVLQTVQFMQDSIISQGNRFAYIRALSHLSASGYASDKFDGFGLYEWVKSFADDFDNKIDSFVKTAEGLKNNILVKDNLTVSVSGSKVDNAIETLIKTVNNNPVADMPEYVTFNFDNDLKSEAIQITGGVSYAATVDNIQNYGFDTSGKFKALSKLMSYQYLWNEIRVLGGAYGCGFVAFDNGNLIYYSYRDPSPANSLEVYKKSSDFIRSYCESDEDFEKFIISACASLEPLIDIRKQTQMADIDYFIGVSYEDKCKLKQELLSMKKEDLLDFCTLLDCVTQNGNTCVVAPKSHIDTLNVDKVYKL